MSKDDARRRDPACPALHSNAAACPPEVSRLSRLALAIGVAWALALSSAPIRAEIVDLRDIAKGRGGFIIDGEVQPLAVAGDVDGDGLDDVIIGAPSYDGRAYVVFGKCGTTAVNLSDVANGIGGFVIEGRSGAQLNAGASVAGIGDINGDGLADVLVDAPGPGGPTRIGQSYVVFGKTDTGAVRLDDLEHAGGGGFVIHHARPSYGPTHVAAAGDVNGDGLGDLIVGWPSNPYHGYDGIAYVVFGKTSSAPVQISKIEDGEGGFAVFCHAYGGNTVAGVGDVNGDGLADISAGEGIGTDKGRTYVVFGKTDTARVDISQIEAGQGGFVIRGASKFDNSGFSAAGAGDVNGDALADLVIGAPYSVRGPMGNAYVVLGKKTTEPVELSDVEAGHRGFIIYGVGEVQIGGVVAGAGDVDGDGLGDFIVGPRGTVYGRRPQNYVIFGKTDTRAVDAYEVERGKGGFMIRSEFDRDNVAAGGADLNGDGLADLLVASPRQHRAYVIFGATTGAFRHTQVDQLGGAGDDTLTGTTESNVFVGGAGDDTFIGNGGADVLYGGMGDDVFLLKSSNVKALFSKFGMNGNTEHLARLDGGAGYDTLRLVGADINLDLVKTANQGGGGRESTSRIESIERIDLTGTGDNTLSIGVKDVQDMAAMNLINSRNQSALGWTNGTYAFPSRVGRHQLVVDGDGGDVVNLGSARNGWDEAGTVFNDGVRYDVYNTNTKPAPSFERVQVIVAHAVTVVVAGQPHGFMLVPRTENQPDALLPSNP